MRGAYPVMAMQMPVRCPNESRQPEELIGPLKRHMREAMGAIATPDRILVAPGLPETHAGNTTQHVLRTMVAGSTDDVRRTSPIVSPTGSTSASMPQVRGVTVATQ